MDKIIVDLINKYPELEKKQRGVPSVGKRKDGLQFSKGVKEIADSYSLYNEKLFKLRKEDRGINNCTLDSGDPLKYELFKPIIKEIKKSSSKYINYKYPRASGDLESRKKIIEYFKKNDFSNISLSEDNIIFTLSTTHAYTMLMRLLVNPGDVVLITAPNYGLFTLISERENLNVRFINLKEENNYLLNPEEFENKIVEINKELYSANKNKKRIPKVVAFLNENPNNPTGKVMGQKQKQLLSQIGYICEKHGLFLIDDLVYKDISYDNENIALPVGNSDKFFSNTISLYGVSKSFGGAGLRAGFILANEVIIRGIKNIIFQDMDSLPLYTSYACAGAYNNSNYRKKHYIKYFNKLINKYKFNYKLLEHLINGSQKKEVYDKFIKKVYKKSFDVWNGIQGVKLNDSLTPESGFFALVDFTDLIKLLNMNKKTTEEELLMFLHANVGIKYIMGKSMMWTDDKQFVGRINYGEDLTILIKTFIELKLFIEKEIENML